MEKNVSYDEDVLLAAVKHFGKLQLKPLISLMYIAKKNGVKISVDFFVDIFGLNSKETRELVDRLGREHMIEANDSTEYDPILLVPTSITYSLNGVEPSTQACETTAKIFKSLAGLSEEEIRDLGLIEYLMDATTDAKKSVEVGTIIGIEPEKIYSGLKLLKKISNV